MASEARSNNNSTSDLQKIKSKLHELKDKLEDEDTSVQSLKAKIKSIEKKKGDSFDEPPLRLDATLHLAWGLTLNLSGVENQVTLGQTIRDYYLKDLVGTYTGEEINDPKTKRYLDNLGSLLSTYLRSVGYEKDVYDNYLNIQRDKRDQKITNINNLADFTSLSSESAIAKIGAFFGIGSIAEFAKSFQSSSQTQQQLSSAVSELAQQAKNDPANAGKISDAISNITAVSNNINSSSTLPSDIALIVAIGFIGVVILTLIFRLVRDNRMLKYIDDAYRLQQEYWESVARPSYFLSLRHLYEDISKLVKGTYLTYKEDILEDSIKANDLIDNILPRTYLYKNNRVVFRWSRIPGCDEAILRAYLIQKFGYTWIDNYEFKKESEDKIVITPKPAVTGDKQPDKRIQEAEKNHQLLLQMENGNAGTERKIHLRVGDREIVVFKAVREMGEMVVYEEERMKKRRNWFG